MVSAARSTGALRRSARSSARSPIEQLGQRPGQERGVGQDPHRAGANFVGAERWTDKPAQEMPRAAATIGGTFGPIRPTPSVSRAVAARLGSLVGLRRRRTLLRSPAGARHSYESNPTRAGHRRHRPGRSAAGRAVKDCHRQVRRRVCARRRRGRHRLALLQSCQTVIGRGRMVTMTTQRHALKLHWTATRAGSGRDLHRRKGQAGNQSRQDRQQSRNCRSPDNPGKYSKPETQGTSRTGYSCIKSRMRCHADIEIACGPPRCATW